MFFKHWFYVIKYHLCDFLARWFDRFFYESIEIDPFDTGEFRPDGFYCVKKKTTRYPHDLETGEITFVSEYWFVGEGLLSGWYVDYAEFS